MPDMQFLHNSGASKLGNIPVMLAGGTRERSVESCKAARCKLLHEKDGGPARHEHEYSLDEALRQVDQAADRGWRATVLLPRAFDARTVKTPAGRTVQVCPAVLHEDVTCNDCGMCCGTQKAGPHYGFPDHGSRKNGSPLCYSQYGTPGLSHGNVLEAVERGADRTLETALRDRRAGAKAFRAFVVGNGFPWFKKKDLLPVFERVKKEGLTVLCYDHWAWRAGAAGAWLKEWAMASCDGIVRRKR